MTPRFAVVPVPDACKDCGRREAAHKPGDWECTAFRLPALIREAPHAGRLGAEALERAAIALYAEQEHATIESCAPAILAGKTEPHSGDCTKQPWTCMVCFRERMLAQARAAFEAAGIGVEGGAE